MEINNDLLQAMKRIVHESETLDGVLTDEAVQSIQYLLAATAADEIERLREALRMVIAANDVFRGTLPKDWESDPVNDACEAARAALEGRHE